MGYEVIIQVEENGGIREEINQYVDLINEAMHLIELQTTPGVGGVRKGKIVSILILRQDV